MRVLGVDIGRARVGLALSDPSRFVATPLATVDAGASSQPRWSEQLADRLAKIAAERRCDTVVVGLPRALSGRATASTDMARAVADALRRRDVVVELWDERLSSVEAERVLLDAGRKRRQRRTERDRVAAAIILQGWLDAHRS